MTFFSSSFQAPFSLLYLAADSYGLCYLNIGAPPFPTIATCCPFLEQAKEQLQRYFQDPCIPFSLPLSLKGTDLQKRTWQYLAENVLSGQQVSYSELAQALKTGARVVGQSMRLNPVPLFVPCHRVLRHDGSLGGYSLGGEQVKRFLLEHERKFSKEQHTSQVF